MMPLETSQPSPLRSPPKFLASRRPWLASTGGMSWNVLECLGCGIDHVNLFFVSACWDCIVSICIFECLYLGGTFNQKHEHALRFEVENIYETHGEEKHSLLKHTVTGWWFGRFFSFSPIVGMIQSEELPGHPRQLYTWQPIISIY
jgi:hypothetical protein